MHNYFIIAATLYDHMSQLMLKNLIALNLSKLSFIYNEKSVYIVIDINAVNQLIYLWQSLLVVFQ